MTEAPDTRIPWVGEHTDDVLREELGLSDDDLGRLRAARSDRLKVFWRR